MKTLLFIFLSALASVTNIGSKSFIKSYNVIVQDTCVTFRPTGYADYPVKPAKDGDYNFVVQVKNNAAKGTYQYIWSPATGVWSSSYMPVKTVYQNISTKVTLTTATTYVRLYYADSATVDNLSYSPDSSGTVDLSPILNRLSTLEQRVTALQKTVDSIPTLYLVPGYGTSPTNPIKP